MRQIKLSEKDAAILKGLIDGVLGSSENEEMNRFCNRLLKQLPDVKGRSKMNN